MISVCPPRLTSGPQPAHDARPHPHRVFMQQRRPAPACRPRALRVRRPRYRLRPATPPPGRPRRCCMKIFAGGAAWPGLLGTLRRCHTTGMQSKVHPTYKTKYRVANWAAYNQALVRRRDVTVWLSAETIAGWTPRRSGRRGGQRRYSDLAIETALPGRGVRRSSSHRPGRRTSLGTARGRPRGIERSRW